MKQSAGSSVRLFACVPAWVFACVSACVAAIVLVPIADGRLHAQVRASKNWNTNSMVSLTVMIDAGGDDVCRGAGIIAGYGKGSLYVLTAEHVIQAIQEEGSIAKLGVRLRAPARNQNSEATERRVPARVMRTDPASDLAAVVIDDPALVLEVRRRADFKLVGDPVHLLPNDQVYAIGCGDGLDWDIPIERTPVLGRQAGAGSSLIPFSRTYVREGYSGGPLIHLFESTSFIVGMTLKVGDTVGRAAPIHEVLQRARSWGVPVKLTPPGTRASCSYKVSPTSVTLTGEKRGAEVKVVTAPECPWKTRGEYDSRLVEMQKYWLDIAVPKEAAELGDPHFGPLSVYIAAGHQALCNGQPQHAVVLVAGQLVQVDWDGRCTNPPPATANIPVRW